MTITYTSEDLIVTTIPAVGNVKWGKPHSGPYAWLPSELDSTGTITPFGGGSSLPQKVTVMTTLGQTVIITPFLVTGLSDVFQNGRLMDPTEYTIPLGVLNLPAQEDGTLIRINQW